MIYSLKGKDNHSQILSRGDERSKRKWNCPLLQSLPSPFTTQLRMDGENVNTSVSLLSLCLYALPCQIFIMQHCHRRTHLRGPNRYQSPAATAAAAAESLCCTFELLTNKTLQSHLIPYRKRKRWRKHCSNPFDPQKVSFSPFFPLSSSVGDRNREKREK